MVQPFFQRFFPGRAGGNPGAREKYDEYYASSIVTTSCRQRNKILFALNKLDTTKSIPF